MFIFCRVDVTFVRGDGTKVKTKGKIGDNLLDVVVNNSIDLDGFGKSLYCFRFSIMYNSYCESDTLNFAVNFF